MTTTFKKVNNLLEVTKTIPKEIVPAKVETNQFNRDFLEKQKIAVEGDLANVIERHTKELETAQTNVDEVKTLLLEADKLGL